MVMAESLIHQRKWRFMADLENSITVAQKAYVTEPLMSIRWLPADDLVANSYNPNRVFSPELKLLEANILAIGWVQPILVNTEGVIIDGFHRWVLSRESPAFQARWKRMVPCAVLDIPREEAMMLTVRMNRAKGSHISVDMSALVKRLVNEHGLSKQAIAEGIGGTQDEVTLLLQDNVFKAKGVADHKYSRAWVPKESRRDPRPSVV